METNLARELKRYYQEKGNKYIFRSKDGEELTLNRLAAKMSEVSGVEIDTSSLSRTIGKQGTQLFDDWQLELFCKVLGLAEEEHWKLSYAIAKDLCLRQGIELNFHVPPPTLDLVMNNLKRIGQARRKNDLTVALDLLNDLYEWRGSISELGLVSTYPLLKIFYWMDIEEEALLSAIEKSRYPTDSILLIEPAFDVYEYLISQADSYLVTILREEDITNRNLAMTVLMDRYNQKLDNYFLRNLPHYLESADFTQELWIDFYNYARSNEIKSAVSTWLFTQAKNKYSDILAPRRTKVHSGPMFSEQEEMVMEANIIKMMEEERNEKLQQYFKNAFENAFKNALESLPISHREIWKLYEQNIPIPVVAKVVNKHPSTVIAAVCQVEKILEEHIANQVIQGYRLID